MTEKITPRDARQGRNGKRVLMILLGGLTLMGIAWVIFELIWK